MKIVVSGGGTGGHIMPAIAIAEAFKEIDSSIEVLYIGGKSGMETEIVPRYSIPFRAVESRKLRKTISWSSVGVLFSLFRGFLEARAVMKEFGADAAVGTGGYAAAATLLAGASLRLPVIVHEGNYLAGRTNKMVARFAKKICVTFSDTQNQFPKGRTEWTGLPVRNNILLSQDITMEIARANFEQLDPDRFTLLVIGGSQGAQAINSVLMSSLPTLLKMGVQIIHQTGQRNIEAIVQIADKLGYSSSAGYLPRAFLNEKELPMALRASNLILCRGGISTLAEAMVNGLPAIVVPLPSAYADHQTYNARAMEAGGAAILLPEAELNGESLTAHVQNLLLDQCRLGKMGSSSLAMGKPKAASDVAKVVLQSIGTQYKS